MEYHSWSRELHDLAYFLPHVLFIAMRWTILAGSLLVAIFAEGESFMGISLQFRTRAAELMILLLESAIEPDHLRYGLLFSFNSVHLFIMFLPFQRSFS